METFHKNLENKIDQFVHLVYKASKKFPREELFGATSQIRRAALSVMLNYVEGFARNRNLVLINFLEISYGSLKECRYLISFSLKEGYATETDCKDMENLAGEIGAMLWTTIKNLKNKKIVT